MSRDKRKGRNVTIVEQMVIVKDMMKLLKIKQKSQKLKELDPF